jgi:hypothetical protein
MRPKRVSLATAAAPGRTSAPPDTFSIGGAADWDGRVMLPDDPQELQLKYLIAMVVIVLSLGSAAVAWLTGML